MMTIARVSSRRRCASDCSEMCCTWQKTGRLAPTAAISRPDQCPDWLTTWCPRPVTTPLSSWPRSQWTNCSYPPYVQVPLSDCMSPLQGIKYVFCGGALHSTSRWTTENPWLTPAQRCLLSQESLSELYILWMICVECILLLLFS